MKCILDMEAEEAGGAEEEMGVIGGPIINEKLVYNDITASNKTVGNNNNASVMTDDFDRTVSEVSMVLPLTFGNNMLFGKAKKQEGDRYMDKGLDQDDEQMQMEINNEEDDAEKDKQALKELLADQ